MAQIQFIMIEGKKGNSGNYISVQLSHGSRLFLGPQSWKPLFVLRKNQNFWYASSQTMNKHIMLTTDSVLLIE